MIALHADSSQSKSWSNKGIYRENQAFGKPRFLTTFYLDSDFAKPLRTRRPRSEPPRILVKDQSLPTRRESKILGKHRRLTTFCVDERVATATLVADRLRLSRARIRRAMLAFDFGMEARHAMCRFRRCGRVRHRCLFGG